MERTAGRVAVVIVDWNAGQMVARCLAALAEQTRPADQVIVVDNASAAPTETWLGRSLPPVDLVRLPENRGFAAGTNVGIARAAACDWIALLNPDAFPEPRWLERLLVAAAENPAFSFLGSRQLAAEWPAAASHASAEARLDGTGDLYAVSGLGWRRDHGAAAAGRRLEREEVFGPCAAAALYKRSALEEAGGLDESFFCYFEDVDLAFRLRLLGHRCLYVPDAVVHHVGSALSGVQSDFSAYHGHRNLVWTWVKNMPGPLLALYWPWHLALSVTSLVHLARRRQVGTWFKAKRDALRQLSRVLRQRREIQARRRVPTRELRQLMVRDWRALGFGRFAGPPA